MIPKPRQWYGLEVCCRPEEEALALGWLWSLDPSGVHEPEAGVWVAYRDSPWDDLLASNPPDPPTLEIRRFEIEDRDWDEAWKASWKPVPLGRRLIVVPAWWRDPIAGDRLQIRIDPGRAFGTGTHESTALAWEALEAALPDVPENALLLDVGTGTGVLALGALGLRPDLRAVGTERDPQAVPSLKDNLALNPQSERFTGLVTDGVPLQPGSVDLAVLNLTAMEHDVVREAVVRVLTRTAVVVASGILDRQEPQQIDRWETYGFKAARRLDRGEWVAWVLKSPVNPL